MVATSRSGIDRRSHRASEYPSARYPDLCDFDSEMELGRQFLVAAYKFILVAVDIRGRLYGDRKLQEMDHIKEYRNAAVPRGILVDASEPRSSEVDGASAAMVDSTSVGDFGIRREESR